MQRLPTTAAAPPALGLLLLVPAAPAFASPPTFSADVAPIFQRACQRCHQATGIGPMALVTYAEVRPWARQIRDRVERRIMPPWHIDPTVGIQAFKNDFSLTDDEIDTVVRWVAAGAPEATRPTCRRRSSGRRRTSGSWPRSSASPTSWCARRPIR